MKNVLLTIEYDGTNFCGWQKQPNERTVQGVLEAALSRITGTEVRLDGTSRTDSGVHARGQRATFSGEFGIPVDRIKPAVNNLLTGSTMSVGENADVRIVWAEEVPAGFHARFDSRGKRYRYAIRNAAEIPVFDRNYRFLVERQLDTDAMREAAAYIIGTHDFRCFQATGSFERKTTVRTVSALDITEIPLPGEPGPVPAEPVQPGTGQGPAEPAQQPARDILIDISGDGFLYNMVRIIAGTLIETGLGKRRPEDMKKVIEWLDRTAAGFTAPPQGLTLMEVFYDTI